MMKSFFELDQNLNFRYIIDHLKTSVFLGVFILLSDLLLKVFDNEMIKFSAAYIKTLGTLVFFFHMIHPYIIIFYSKINILFKIMLSIMFLYVLLLGYSMANINVEIISSKIINSKG